MSRQNASIFCKQNLERFRKQARRLLLYLLPAPSEKPTGCVVSMNFGGGKINPSHPRHYASKTFIHFGCGIESVFSKKIADELYLLYKIRQKQVGKAGQGRLVIIGAVEGLQVQGEIHLTLKSQVKGRSHRLLQRYLGYGHQALVLVHLQLRVSGDYSSKSRIRTNQALSCGDGIKERLQG